MKVKEIMNENVVVLHPNMSIREASELLEKNKIGGAPVVDNNGKLVGILTTKDIISLVKSRMENIGIYIVSTPFDFMDFYQFDIPLEDKRSMVDEISRIKVGEIMRKKVHTVREEDDIYKLLDILVKKEVSRVPVVDKDERVVGIITRSDVLKVIPRIK